MSAPLLEASGLTKRFGGLTAVDGLDFVVWPGEILGVIGPNGAGKSTTFGLVAGAIPPTSGAVRFDGEPILGLPAHRIAERGILRTFQHNKPFAGMSLRENVLVGMHTRFASTLWSLLASTPGARSEEARAAQRADELIDFVGLREWQDAAVDTLSFGQGRLLEVARALAGEPKLILFDEPAAGLTPAECTLLVALIQRIAERGIAVLLIEHDMRFLFALASRVLVLNFGRKIAEGSPEEVRSDAAVTEAYLGEPGALAVHRTDAAAGVATVPGP